MAVLAGYPHLGREVVGAYQQCIDTRYRGNHRHLARVLRAHGHVEAAREVREFNQRALRQIGRIVAEAK